jgi:flagellar biosynthetic protein FliR
MELATEKLLGFVMVLTRISAFFMAAPVFNWNTIPLRVKLAFVLLITFFFSMIKPSGVSPDGVRMLEAILLISNEAIYGLALGLIVVLVFTAVRFSGQIIEQQMGLTMASILDPMTDEMGGPLCELMEIIFILLFFSANGHHLFLAIISRSYDAFPAGTMPSIPILAGGIINAGSTLLIAGLRLAGPMLAALLLLMVVLAVLARITPEMNILFESLSMQVGLGLIMAGIFLPFISEFVAEFADWMGKLLPL